MSNLANFSDARSGKPATAGRARTWHWLGSVTEKLKEDSFKHSPEATAEYLYKGLDIVPLLLPALKRLEWRKQYVLRDGPERQNHLGIGLGIRSHSDSIWILTTSGGGTGDFELSELCSAPPAPPTPIYIEPWDPWPAPTGETVFFKQKCLRATRKCGCCSQRPGENWSAGSLPACMCRKCKK